MEKNIGQEAKAVVARLPRHSFKFPEGVRELDTDPSSITIRQLTFGEEQQALTAAEVNKTSFAYEGAMRSIVAADGVPVTWENDGKATFFSGVSNKIRDLIIRAFTNIALPKKEDVDSFFNSRTTEAGE